MKINEKRCNIKFYKFVFSAHTQTHMLLLKLSLAKLFKKLDAKRFKNIK